MCRFVNEELQRRERIKDLFRRTPGQGTHRENVVLTLSNSKLLLKVPERKEFVGSIKLLIILTVTALYLSIVPWRVRTDQLMPDSQFHQGPFKNSQLFCGQGVEPVGKFRAIVCLNALNGIGEFSDTVSDKLGGGIGTVLLKGLQIPETAVFVQKCVLVVSTFVGGSTNQTAFWNVFDVDLDSLTGIAHLLIGLGDILGVWQFHRHLSALSQKAVQAGDGTCITSLPQLHPEHHQARIGIPAAHILNKLDLVGAVLVWMAVRAM